MSIVADVFGLLILIFIIVNKNANQLSYTKEYIVVLLFQQLVFNIYSEITQSSVCIKGEHPC